MLETNGGNFPMETLKIENLGNAQSTTRTLKLNETESLHGGLPANGLVDGDGRVIDAATGEFTGEVFGNPNANGDRGLFAGGQAVGLLRDGRVIVRGRDSGFRVRTRSFGREFGNLTTVTFEG